MQASCWLSHRVLAAFCVCVDRRCLMAHRRLLGACGNNPVISHVHASLCAPRHSQLLRLTCNAAAEPLQRISELQERAASRPPRFYVPPSSSLTFPATELLLEGDEARHALRALRLREGDPVELCDGRGHVLLCSLTTADKGRNKAWVAPTAPVQFIPWQGPKWTLAVGLPSKGGRAEWLVEKATELGCWELIPLITDRCQYSSGSKGNKYKRSSSPEEGEAYEPTRLERVAVAATKQCLREHNMTLHAPMKLEQLIQERLPSAEVALLAVAGGTPLLSALHQRLTKTDAVQGHVHGGGGYGDGLSQQSDSAATRLLLVGPEGDWTPAELDSLTKCNVTCVGLGRTRLRTETAAIAMLSAAALWEC